MLKLRNLNNGLLFVISNKKTPWPESASELYRPSDRCLSVKLVPTFADRGCHVVRVTDPYDRILGFLDRSRYYFLQVAPQLHLRGWMDLVVPGIEPRTSGSVARNSDHYTTDAVVISNSV
jgi:hypothetical protein